MRWASGTALNTVVVRMTTTFLSERVVALAQGAASQVSCGVQSVHWRAVPRK